MPQLEGEDSLDFIFQQEGAALHFHDDVRRYLNDHLPKSWMGRSGRDVETL